MSSSDKEAGGSSRFGKSVVSSDLERVHVRVYQKFANNQNKEDKGIARNSSQLCYVNFGQTSCGELGKRFGYVVIDKDMKMKAPEEKFCKGDGFFYDECDPIAY